ncbi:MAG: PQQ-like beta-propeller repeat protein [Gemmatimonadetes bacterium]|nr:PQQ-like beta-propeller repeat protein [Gemmatimonadota bacterium]
MLLTEDRAIVPTDGQTGFLYAFDLASGEPVWKVSAGSGIAVDLVEHDGRVYAFTLQSEVLAIDPADGAIIWRRAFHREGAIHRFMGLVPAVAGSTLVVGCLDGFVRALDLSRGDTVWERDLGAGVSSSVLSAGDFVVTGTVDSVFSMLSIAGGDTIRTAHAGGEPRGNLVALGEDGSFASFLARNAWEGRMTRWSPDLEREWVALPPNGSAWISQRPYRLGERWILAGTSSGVIGVIDIDSGELVQEFAVEPEYDWDGDGLRSFGFSDGKLFVGSVSGMLYCYDLAAHEKGRPREETGLQTD